eukprot:gene33530-40565_t
MNRSRARKLKKAALEQAQLGRASKVPRKEDKSAAELANAEGSAGNDYFSHSYYDSVSAYDNNTFPAALEPEVTSDNAADDDEEEEEERLYFDLDDDDGDQELGTEAFDPSIFIAQCATTFLPILEDRMYQQYSLLSHHESVNNNKLYDGCQEGETHQSFEVEWNKAMGQYVESQDGINKLTAILNRALPPHAPKIKAQKIEEMSNDDKCLFTYDCCAKGCIVYDGDFSGLDKCPTYGFQHGNVPRQHMADMKNVFLNSSSPSSSIEVSLILTLYYDGAMLFKRSVNPFWPLLISIANLPPTIRTAYGIGMFSISLISVDPGTPVEQFVLGLLGQELQLLFKGFTVTTRGCNYFVQARVTSQVYDSRALEKVLNVQGAGSGAGCPLCRQVPGWGQTEKCCPLDYYKDNEVRDRDMKAQLEHRKLRNDSDVKSLIVNFGNKGALNVFLDSICEATSKDEVKTILTGNNPWKCYNKEPYHIDSFLASMFYAFAEARPYVDMCRVGNETLSKDATTVQLSNGVMKECNGVKGFWALGAYLGYVDFAKHVNYDPFHALMNVAVCILKHLLGMRAISQLTKLYCEIYQMFPRLWDSTTNFLPWALPPTKEKRIEGYLEAVYVPTGLKNEYRMTKLYQQFGHYNGMQKIRLVECAMDYVTFCAKKVIEESNLTHLKECKQYMHLFRMMSSIMSRLEQPVFVSTEQIENLHFDVLEAIEVYCSMFPPSEARMVQHHLTHLARYIKEQGPLRDWSSAPSEQAISHIKKQVNNGGVSWDVNASHRVFAFEKASLNKYYEDIHDILRKDISFQHVSNKDVLEYEDFPFHVFNNRRTVVFTTFSTSDQHDYQKAKFIDFLVQESIRIYGIVKSKPSIADQRCRDLIRASGLYRLYCVFLAFRNRAVMTFYEGECKERKVMNKFGEVVTEYYDHQSKRRICFPNELYFWMRNVELTFLVCGVRVDHQNTTLVDSQIDEILDGQLLLQSDLNNIPIWIDYLKNGHRHYSQATIWGVKMHAREKATNGKINNFTRELFAPRKIWVEKGGEYKYEPKGEANKIDSIDLSTGKGNKDMSSWCRIHHYANDNLALYGRRNSSPAKFTAAQINYFTVLEFPSQLASEPTLHLPIASVTCRSPMVIRHNDSPTGPLSYENLWQISCFDRESYDWEGNWFTALYNIYPTPIATVPVDASHEPINKLQNKATIRKPRYLLQFALARKNEWLFNDEDSLRALHPYHNPGKL